MIINCTAHAIDLYEPQAPDVLTPPDEARQTGLRLSIPASGRIARIAELPDVPIARPGTDVLAAHDLPGIIDVQFGNIVDLPDPVPGRWFIVGLVVALAVPARRDLLVPYRQVRNVAKTVIGCRALARPC